MIQDWASREAATRGGALRARLFGWISTVESEVGRRLADATTSLAAVGVTEAAEARQEADLLAVEVQRERELRELVELCVSLRGENR